jgi:hypothetical protein
MSLALRRWVRRVPANVLVESAKRRRMGHERKEEDVRQLAQRGGGTAARAKRRRCCSSCLRQLSPLCTPNVPALGHVEGIGHERGDEAGTVRGGEVCD